MAHIKSGKRAYGRHGGCGGVVRDIASKWQAPRCRAIVRRVSRARDIERLARRRIAALSSLSGIAKQKINAHGARRHAALVAGADQTARCGAWRLYCDIGAISPYA